MTPAKRRVFLDGSVLVAAAGSPSGGSALVIEICRGQRFAAICSQRVLLEAQINIRSKLPTEAMVRFYQLLAALSPMLIPPTTAEDEARYTAWIAAKDAHVIAAAVHGGTDFLLSLDRKHLVNDRMRSAGLLFQVLTPDEFIQQIFADSSIGR
jgi:predicted nucleic acid-binding protein